MPLTRPEQEVYLDEDGGMTAEEVERAQIVVSRVAHLFGNRRWNERPKMITFDCEKLPTKHIGKFRQSDTGCAGMSWRRTWIWVSDDQSHTSQEITLIHELVHCMIGSTIGHDISFRRMCTVATVCYFRGRWDDDRINTFIRDLVVQYTDRKPAGWFPTAGWKHTDSWEDPHKNMAYSEQETNEHLRERRGDEIRKLIRTAQQYRLRVGA